MRIFLSNDDGYFSEGIRLLRNTLIAAGHEVWGVAPAVNRSGCGHAVSCGTELKISQEDERFYSCSGYPADCVLVALLTLLPQRPDLIISGPNEGANLADDVCSSGTAAAAREGARAGIPSVALSALGPAPVEFHWAVNFACANLVLLRDEWREGTFWNINVPSNPQGVELTIFGRREYQNNLYESYVDERVSYCRVLGSHQDLLPVRRHEDVHAVRRQNISVSRAEVRFHAHRPRIEEHRFQVGRPLAL